MLDLIILLLLLVLFQFSNEKKPNICAISFVWDAGRSSSLSSIEMYVQIKVDTLVLLLDNISVSVLKRFSIFVLYIENCWFSVIYLTK